MALFRPRMQRRAVFGCDVAIMATLVMAVAMDASAQSARRALLRSVRPPFGVGVRVDGGERRPVSSGEALVLDGGAHDLWFACDDDACEPRTVRVAAGLADEVLDVALAIRAARLVVEGDPAHRFLVVEEPWLGCACPGVPLAVPLRSAREMVHVREMETGRTIAAVLVAGRATRVWFGRTG